MVARLTSNISPTLLNEFVASYTTDHISFNLWATGSIPRATLDGLSLQQWRGGKLPAINVGAGTMCMGRRSAGSGRYLARRPYNSNPTYTYRDNMTKIVGRHNLTFGAYFVAAAEKRVKQRTGQRLSDFRKVSASVHCRAASLWALAIRSRTC